MEPTVKWVPRSSKTPHWFARANPDETGCFGDGTVEMETGLVSMALQFDTYRDCMDWCEDWNDVEVTQLNSQFYYPSLQTL